MIKILQVGITYQKGGIESFVINTYKNIDKSQYRFDYINIYKKELAGGEVYNNNSKIFQLASYKTNPIRFSRQFAKLLKEEKYDIVHVNMSSAVFLIPLIIAKKQKIKTIICHAHNSMSDKGFIKSLLHNMNKKLIPRYANTYFACSMSAAKWFFSKKIINSKRFYLLHNAISIEEYKYNIDIRKKKRKELGCDEKTLVVGNVGRFSKVKNHSFLIDIFKEILTYKENSMLVLVGIGEEQERIMKKVKELNINKKVKFEGYQTKVSEYMNAFDAFVMPSLNEGFPFVAVEAQASGLNCFFSTGVSTEVNINGKCRFISLDDSPDKWGKEIINNYYNKYREYGYDICSKAGYNIKIETRKIEKVYYNLSINKEKKNEK